jgi:hypothetical protein
MGPRPGAWAGGGPTTSAGQVFLATGTIPVAAPQRTDAAHVVYSAGSSATHCPGRGRAEAGYLCVYQLFNTNANSPPSSGAIHSDDGSLGPAPSGFGVLFTSAAAGSSFIGGEWAYTAP